MVEGNRGQHIAFYRWCGALRRLGARAGRAGAAPAIKCDELNRSAAPTAWGLETTISMGIQLVAGYVAEGTAESLPLLRTA